ncbi:MAG: efflux transporter periplasmic adaptor subunit [Deltaproteobacteria bacterium RIFCSPLOWO2_02_FULL_53_8]|nr:MAG: efflux transporter periplasmic adaptor subunit [Deltaproteobacteria bacterium RIFCSPLOWO2_02_FULL_53_8]
MKRLPITGRTLALIGVLVPLIGLFIYVALRSGHLAPVPVTVTLVRNLSISPAISGIGAVEARYTYKIGPTVAGRVKIVDVNVGDRVKAGQMLGEMDPVDLDDRGIAQEATFKRANAAALSAEAQVRDTMARYAYADSQAKRYEELLRSEFVSVVDSEAKQQERLAAEAGLASARANLDAARHELSRIRAENEGIGKQRANLRLIAPVDGLVVSRNANPGTTVIAGQAVVEIIDPKSLWVNVRFNQLDSSGLAPGLPARIVLRSDSGQQITGTVERVEPLADAVTEETLAKVTFDSTPEAAQVIGELAEVTVALPAVEAAPVVPNASIQRLDGKIGVWMIDDGRLRFTQTKIGATDMDGLVQVIDGVKTGEKVVVYSQRALSVKSRVKVVEQLPGITQ